MREDEQTTRLRAWVDGYVGAWNSSDPAAIGEQANAPARGATAGGVRALDVNGPGVFPAGAVRRA